MTDLPYAEVEAWLKGRRDRYERHSAASWYALDAALDDLREHYQTGTPLNEIVQHHEEDSR